jgi:hypothetical protein
VVEKMGQKRKLFWIAFAFVFLSFFLYQLIVFTESIHSEGLMMISDIGEKILGVDFVKKEFIYPHPREKKILPFLSIVKHDFLPYLRLKIFELEIPILWKEYHGGLLAWLFKILDKLFFFLGDYLRTAVKLTIFAILFTFLFLYFLFKLLEGYFFINKFVVYSMLFFTLSSPIFHFLKNTFHHSQACIFILIMLYFLKKRRYILSGLFAGLAVYSYLPIVFAILGLTLTSFLYHRSFKTVFFVGLFSLIFSSPHLYYILSSKNEVFHNVYNCSNCVGLFPPSTLNYFVRGQREFLGLYDLFKILLYLFVSLVFLPFKIHDLVSSLHQLKESFSVSDVMIRYGALIQPPPFKYISDVAIVVHLIILAFGIFYIKRRFEIVAYFFSLFFYGLLSKYFMLLPKMIYFFFPIYVLVAVRVFNEFVLHKQKLIMFIFILSSVLRLAEFIQLGRNIRAIDLKTNLEVINFFKNKNVKSNEILLYCFPPPFKIFTNGKLNPPVFLFIFEKADEFLRKRTVEFVIKQTNFKYIVFDISLLKLVYEIIWDENKKLDLRIVFRNDDFFIVEVERYEDR